MNFQMHQLVICITAMEQRLGNDNSMIDDNDWVNDNSMIDDNDWAMTMVKSRGATEDQPQKTRYSLVSTQSFESVHR
jgi:hypothetical protein